VAKKRKGSKSSPASASKKRYASAPAARPVKPKKPKKPITGLENRKQVDFTPLKKQLRAHIARLEKAKKPSPAIANALRSLRQVSEELSVECSPSMILPTS
jgi:hypothetical protein